MLCSSYIVQLGLQPIRVDGTHVNHERIVVFVGVLDVHVLFVSINHSINWSDQSRDGLIWEKEYPFRFDSVGVLLIAFFFVVIVFFSLVLLVSLNCELIGSIVVVVLIVIDSEHLIFVVTLFVLPVVFNRLMVIVNRFRSSENRIEDFLLQRAKNDFDVFLFLLVQLVIRLENSKSFIGDTA